MLVIWSFFNILQVHGKAQISPEILSLELPFCFLKPWIQESGNYSGLQKTVLPVHICQEQFTDKEGSHR